MRPAVRRQEAEAAAAGSGEAPSFDTRNIGNCALCAHCGAAEAAPALFNCPAQHANEGPRYCGKA